MIPFKMVRFLQTIATHLDYSPPWIALRGDGLSVTLALQIPQTIGLLLIVVASATASDFRLANAAQNDALASFKSRCGRRANRRRNSPDMGGVQRQAGRSRMNRDAAIIGLPL
jgi:hypothetical protein